MKPRSIAPHTITGYPSLSGEDVRPVTVMHNPRAATAAPPPAGLSVLESRYPGVIHAITLLWGYAEMNDYFAKLWMGDGPASQRLDPDALAELMLLARVHELIMPARSDPNTTIYGTQYNRASHGRQDPPRPDAWEYTDWRRR